MKKISANGYVLTALGSIAWLFNVRGDDILFNPLVVSYGLVLENEAYLFVDNHRLSEDVKTYLTENGVTLKDYAQIDEVLNQLSGSILCPVDSMNYYLYDILTKKQEVTVID